MDITDLAEDHPAIDITDAGNGYNNGVEPEHNVFHFGFNFIDLPIDQLDLVDRLSYLQR